MKWISNSIPFCLIVRLKNFVERFTWQKHKIDIHGKGKWGNTSLLISCKNVIICTVAREQRNFDSTPSFFREIIQLGYYYGRKQFNVWRIEHFAFTFKSYVFLVQIAAFLLNWTLYAKVWQSPVSLRTWTVLFTRTIRGIHFESCISLRVQFHSADCNC